MDDLVKRLSEGQHPVELEPKIKELTEIKERLENGFVFIKFTGTNGGTEIGIDIDRNLTDLTKVSFESGKGTMQIMGTCKLNFHEIKCVANVELATRTGSGYLIPLK